ncbi:MAG TPA: Ig-like domain repeat protein [Bacteroidota bacterium]|nr:Ig-like domain repeat protein [Bacteroidota bacterium]
MKQATFLFQNLLIITLIAITITKGDQYRSNGSGLWISTSVWQKSTDGGATYSASSTIPGNSNTDTALIRNTHTITINTNFTIAKLTVGQGSSGILTFDGTSRAINILSDVYVAIGGQFRSASANSVHSMTIGGNLTVNGTFNMRVTSPRVVDVVFNNNGNQIINGTGTIAFNNLTLNMGSSSLNTLDVMSVISMNPTSTSPSLTLLNGTFKLSSASNITPFGGGDVVIPLTAGYYLNHFSAQSKWSGAGSLIVDGFLTLANGTMDVGTGSGGLEIGSTGTVDISGGVLNNKGRFQVDEQGGLFVMHDGTINISKSNGSLQTTDVLIMSPNATMLGGTFSFTSNSASTVITMKSIMPFYNLMIENSQADVTVQLVDSTLTILNDLTIVSGTLDASGFSGDIVVDGDWMNSGVFLPGSSTVRFNGSGYQNIQEGNFDDLTIENIGVGVMLLSDTYIGGVLSVLSGSVSTGASIIFLGSNAVVSEPVGNSILGTITTTRDIASTSGIETFGNIGCDVVLNGTALGVTTVMRTTGGAFSGNGNNSILRHFDVMPTVNTSLNAGFIFHFDESELNGQDANTLELYKSDDYGVSWTNRGGVINTQAHTISLSGINGFSQWTASDHANTLGNTPIPTIDAISPTSKVVGESAFTLTIQGRGFVDGKSGVNLNGSDRQTIYVSETQLHALIPSSDLTSAGSFSVIVVNSDGGGESNEKVFAVQRAATSAVMSSDVSPSIYGQSVQLSVGVDVLSPGSGIPTGTVILKEGGVVLGSGTLDAAGRTVLPRADLSVGSHSLRVYYSGDANYDSSTSIEVSQLVNRSNTLTNISSNINPSSYGQEVTINVSVSANSPGAGIPTGIVTIKNDSLVVGSVILNGSGQGNFSTALLFVGTHKITAEYGGDANFVGSISSSLTEVVGKAISSTTISSDVNPSSFGENINFTVSVDVVSPGAVIPSGLVALRDGQTVLGTKMMDSTGKAVFAISSLTAGTHSLSADYVGDTNVNGSSSSVWVQNVSQSGSTIIVTSNINPSIYGQPVVFATKVTGDDYIPSGSVIFMDGSTILGSATLDDSGNAILVTNSLMAGNHSIRVQYSGDTNHGAGVSPSLDQRVNKADVNLAVRSLKNPSVYGESITMVAVLTSSAGVGTPSGSVVFKEGTIELGVSPLDSSGNATLHVPSLTMGDHSITVDYAGDSDFNSGAGVLSPVQKVEKASSLVAVVASNNQLSFGQPVTITTQVSAVAPSTGNPTGTVRFLSNNFPLVDAVELVNGTANISISQLEVGTHHITVEYSGSNEFNNSNGSLNPDYVVTKASSLISLSSDFNPSDYGSVVRFTVIVKGEMIAPTKPIGDVQFYLDNLPFGGPVALSNEVASLATSSISGGEHIVFAIYSGDSNYQSSTSKGLLQIINKKSVVMSLTSLVNPSIAGKPTTFQIAIDSTVPTGGDVQFKIGTENLGEPVSISLDGKATLTTSNLVAGIHTISAIYSGSENFEQSVSNLVTQEVLLEILVSVNARWNIVSNPISSSSELVRDIFPTSMDPIAFSYSGGTYQPTSRMANRYGYWSKFPEARVDTLRGVPIATDTIPLQSGWNLIGSISYPVDTTTIRTIPEGILASNYFGYNGNGYAPTSIVTPGRGYWVKSNDAGKLVLSSQSQAKVASVESGLFESMNSITITDNSGASQTLYFGPDAGNIFKLNMFELPPSPPTGIFDARFESQRILETYQPKVEKHEGYPFVVRSAEYPLTITWNVQNGENETIILRAGISEDALPEQALVNHGQIVITQKSVDRFVIVVEPVYVPTVFALQQNYPNPFNPTTRIQFDLPVTSFVTLKVYNTIGQEIVRLKDRETMTQGTKEIEFQALELPSGVYFYQVIAEVLDESSQAPDGKSFVDVKKMILMR